METAEKVLHFFEEISRIPRESGDERAVSDYLLSFAKQRNFEAYRDECNNVIIKKPATVAGCTCAPVIIQGHTDMVYVSEADCKIPYEDGVRLIYKDGWLTADGTTLGADNGIAVAYALAVLDSDKIEHPDLEAVFTVSEEVGLLGAKALDYSRLKGKYLLNLDTEEEGVFFTSCAGAFRNELKIPVEREKLSGACRVSLKIGGLYGGHSGMEIHRGRGNAITLMARLLTALGDGVHISEITAEGKMNAICNNALAVLYCDEANLEKLENIVRNMEKDFKRELAGRDDVSVMLIKGETGGAACYTEESRKRVIHAMSLLPNGVLGMSFDVPGLVETSANPGFVVQSENELSIFSSARSSVGSRKHEMRGRYAAIAHLCGAESICSGDYPQWEYRADSPLRRLAMCSYKELFGGDAKAKAIHAGLECGFFDERLPDVDIISFGPNLLDVHTPMERAELASVERVWQLTQLILQKLTKK